MASARAGPGLGPRIPYEQTAETIPNSWLKHEGSAVWSCLLMLFQVPVWTSKLFRANILDGKIYCQTGRIIMNTLRKILIMPILTVVAVFSSGPNPAHACSVTPYIASVCITAMTFCPRGYAEANGQLLSISQNTAVFALIGTIYGGDGRVTFALPDLRSRSPVHVGTGPGLSKISQGQKGGAETVTQSVAQMAFHNHAATTIATLRGKGGGGNTGDSADLTGRVLAARKNVKIYGPGPANAAMDSTSIVATTAVDSAGDSQPQENRSPFLSLRYCIALTGVFPPRN